MTYTCPKGCFSDDPHFRCGHSGAARDTVIDVDLTQVDAVVKAAIRGTIRAPEYHDSPAWKAFRHRRKVTGDNDRRFRKAQAEGDRRRKAWADEVIKRADDFNYCPVLPRPAVWM